MEIEEGSLDNGLGEETWLKIFGYLPKSDRANVRLVNSLFNKLICKIEKFRYVLRVTEENLTDIGISLTKRRFNEVKFDQIIIDHFHVIAMCDILRVHGKTIEIMTVSSRINETKEKVESIPASRIMSLFVCVPNLKKLDWCTPNMRIKDWYAYEPRLEKLEYLGLKIYEKTSLDFAYIFTPGTIKEFKFGLKWKYLKDFLACQSNIKDLTLEQIDTNIDVNVFNHLKLDSFAVIGLRESEPIRIQMIGQHPELKKVIRSGNRDFTYLPLLRAYCSLVNLEYIELLLDDAAWNEVHRIAELPKLREIKLDMGGSSHQALRVASIQLPNVEKINFIGEFEDFLILETAGRNWPNLKHLKISPDFFYGIDVLNYYFDNFDKLESFVIKAGTGGSICDEDICYDVKHNIIPFEMLHFTFHSQHYPYLKSLTVINASILHLEHLLTALPNLELLHIDEERSNIYSRYCLIKLEGLKQLKHLRVMFTEQSKFARFSTQEGTLIKKLCRRLKSFKIIFGGSLNFQKSMRTLLRGCDTFNLFPEDDDYDYRYECEGILVLTTLENIEY